MKALLTLAAQKDIALAAGWYENRKAGLGLEFTDRVLEAIERIEKAPFGYAKVIGEARRCNLEQFPYGLYFRVEEDAIVIACLHHKRDARLAKERVLGVIEFPKPPEPS